MKKKNQLADLKRLIALPTKDMKRQYEQYIYEDASHVLPMLFRLARSLSGKQEKSNIVLLLKNLIEQSDDYYDAIPEWMVPELDTFIRNPLFTDRQKAHVLSTFDPDELFNRVITFEKFVQRFVEIRESFEDYIVREIRGKRSRLFDIYSTILEKTTPDVIRTMILDLKGSTYPEASELLELFTYTPNPDLSGFAYHALRGSDTPYTPLALKSIVKLNPMFSDQPSSPSGGVKRTFPEAFPVSPKDREILDIQISLPDGDGATTSVIGARLSRNDHMFMQISFLHRFGIRNVSFYPSLNAVNYKEVRETHIDDIGMFPSSELFLRKLIEHFMHESKEAGFPIPAEIIALKNLMGWFDLSAGELPLSKVRAGKPGYTLSDLERLPFSSWWLKDNRISNMLFPFREIDVTAIPEEILFDIAIIYSDHAAKNLPFLCGLCSEIMLHSGSDDRVSMSDTFLAIRSELSSRLEDPFASLFVFYETVNTVHHTILNLQKGLSSVELF